MSEVINHYISWNGKVTFSDESITEEQYKQFFEAELISYALVQATLKTCKGSDLELTVDYLKPAVRNEVINNVAYGNGWLRSPSYHNLPNFHATMKVQLDGEEVNYYQLPYPIRKHIAKEIVEEDHFTGKVAVQAN